MKMINTQMCVYVYAYMQGEPVHVKGLGALIKNLLENYCQLIDTCVERACNEDEGVAQELVGALLRVLIQIPDIPTPESQHACEIERACEQEREHPSRATSQTRESRRARGSPTLPRSTRSPAP